MKARQISSGRARIALVSAIAASLAACAVLLSAGPAKAAQAHGFSTSFGEAGTGSGQLALIFPTLTPQGKPLEPGSGLAVNDDSGDVYVADTGNHRVDEFSPGKPAPERFVRAFGADVGGAGVDVCTTGCGPGTPGTSPGELEDPTFIAVDNSKGASDGAVYVVDSGGSEEDRISKFSGEGALETTWGTGGQLDEVEGEAFGEIEGIGVDAAGHLWVQTRSMEFVLDEDGALVEDGEYLRGAQPTGLALDGAGHIYMLEGFPEGPIYKYGTTFEVNKGRVVLPDLGAVFAARHFFSGIASDQTTHDLYADQEGISIADIPPGCEPRRDPAEGLCAPSQVFGEGDLDLAAGLAADSADGTVFAASTETQQVDVFPVTLEATVEAADEIKATSATLHGIVDPKGASVTRCSFQYGTSVAYGQELPCLDSSGEAVGTASNPITGPTEVHASADGLEGGIGQHFRLRAGNPATGVFVSSEDEAFTTLPLAVIEAIGVQAAEGSATLTANVNPKGITGTTCEVEWGATSAYGTSVPCEPPTPSGSSPVAVAAHLNGLDPTTTYHFRFVVADENGTVRSSDHTFVITPVQSPGSCPNEALREANASTALPDCRAYELITPMDKNGALIGALFANNIPAAIADDGEKVIAPSIQCFAQSPSCVGTRIAEGEPFEFSRTSSGWATRSLALPATSFETSSAWRFDPNNGTTLFSAPLESGQDQWYVRQGDGTVSVLGGPLWEVGHALSALEQEATITTADFSHVVFESKEPFWAYDAGENSAENHARGLYEYPNPNGAGPQLVAVSGGAGSNDLIGICGTTIAGREGFNKAYGTLSADGAVVYFEVQQCAKGSGANTGAVPVRELFARIDGDRTVALSQPQALAPAPANPACGSAACIANTTKPERFRTAFFQGASGDGSRAYFVSPQQLTDSASQDPIPADQAGPQGRCRTTTGANGCNLYLYEDPQQQPLSGTHLFDASAGDTSGLGPEVQGVLAISGDGSHAYFVAKGVLAEAPNAEGQHAVEGANNLYLYEHDAAHPQGQTTFVATLPSADEAEWGELGHADVTDDGRYLVFTSHRGLTSDAGGEGAGQIYRYDASTGLLQRISFGQHGYNDDGNSGHADAGIALAARSLIQRVVPSRTDPTMSEDGSKIFFQSSVALAPAALNEQPVEGEPARLAVNVYEWESDGTGSCAEARGCVWLVSDGKDRAGHAKVVDGAVELLGSDRAGENVFFATTDQLVISDTDTQRDYYDARVDGGFPAAASPPPCEADACRQGTTSAPLLGPLGSLTFSGPGNVPLERSGPSSPPPASKPLTKAQKLAKALKACRKKGNKRKRLACEKSARKRFGSKAAKKKSKQRSSAKHKARGGRR
jgi:hypothetical protein